MQWDVYYTQYKGEWNTQVEAESLLEAVQKAQIEVDDDEWEHAFITKVEQVPIPNVNQ